MRKWLVGLPLIALSHFVGWWMVALAAAVVGFRCVAKTLLDAAERNGWAE